MRLRAGEKGALQRVDNAEDPIRRDLALARASRLRRKSILRAAGSMFSMAAESMVSLDAGSMVSMDASVGFLEEDIHNTSFPKVLDLQVVDSKGTSGDISTPSAAAPAPPWANGPLAEADQRTKSAQGIGWTQTHAKAKTPSWQPTGNIDNSASFSSVAYSKFVARELILGDPSHAAEGLKEMLGLNNLAVFGNLLKQSVDAIETEFCDHGNEHDRENLRYCLYGIAQDPDWIPGRVKIDILKGFYHGGALSEGDYDMGHEGMTLDDFVKHPRSKLGKLGREHVLALRLYTTSSFSKFNEPLRKREKPHPFRMTVYYLDEALRKLRAVRASLDARGFAAETLLWRGMKDTVVRDPMKFLREGGTELALMSTTESRDVALIYADSEHPLLFQFHAKGMCMGVDISFLSVYPKEQEVLYPPLTYLMPRETPTLEDGITIYAVEPSIS
eukprot:CAMPEP_0180373084 /NCGR_PEP_ID=MMETSP0989-20121125/21054_1 /TAXON_ID=697907 /ORGANISM="non described non described, Strain CCMP2293" /LENGTH=444 /DNA_ID=CAMNT_0022369931 /DNA_START=30 /DNA_END=1364 /DNA_ORIENTATION=+